MTRDQAQHIIYEIINSGIVSEEIKESLNDLANTLCFGEFEKCETNSPYCAGCKHLCGGGICEE